MESATDDPRLDNWVLAADASRRMVQARSLVLQIADSSGVDHRALLDRGSVVYGLLSALGTSVVAGPLDVDLYHVGK